MANKYNIVDGFTPSMLTDITRKIQTKFEVSSQKFLLALENKNQLLTNMEVILKIAMGCTRYMDVGLGLDVKSVIQSAKKSLQQPTKKSLEVSAINQKLVDLNYGENPFRPWHVHNPLFEAGVNIRKETLSKVLKYHIAMNILSKSKQLPRKKHCERTEKISGPNSYYESSSFLKEIRRVLGVPEAAQVIIALLLESGILTRFVYSIMLWHVYVNEIKEQEIWKGGTMIVTTIGVDFPEELIFDPRKDFDEVKIMEEAFRLTEKSLEKILQDNSTILPTITMGGVRFQDYNFGVP